MLQDIYLYDYLFSKLNYNLQTKNGKNKTFGRVTKSKDYSLLSARGKNLGQAFLKACGCGQSPREDCFCKCRRVGKTVRWTVLP